MSAFLRGAVKGAGDQAVIDALDGSDAFDGFDALCTLLSESFTGLAARLVDVAAKIVAEFPLDGSPLFINAEALDKVVDPPFKRTLLQWAVDRLLLRGAPVKQLAERKPLDEWLPVELGAGWLPEAPVDGRVARSLTGGERG